MDDDSFLQDMGQVRNDNIAASAAIQCTNRCACARVKCRCRPIGDVRECSCRGSTIS